MLDLTTMSPAAWTVLVFAACISGISKTGLPGVGLIAIIMFTLVLPARESTGIVLVLLIAGDCMALLLHRRQAEWKLVLRMMPIVLVGLAGGVLFLLHADDYAVQKVIAVIILFLLTVKQFSMSRPRVQRTPTSLRSGFTRVMFGSLAGFATMVANSAGAIMSMYFLARGMPTRAFLGTMAWFFAIVNLAKLPVSISIGLVTLQSLLLNAALLPALAVGGLLGYHIALRIEQQAFERIVLLLTWASALYLLIR